MKKRNPKSRMEKEGVIYVRQATNDAGHIFREVLEEDVGIDAYIELCGSTDEATGKIVGLQIKSGDSYIRSETDTAFTYYSKATELQYWRSYSLPLYLVIYRPSKHEAYWVDIKKGLDQGVFEDMLSGLKPKKLVIDKGNTFSKNFFPGLLEEFGDESFCEWAYNAYLQSFASAPPSPYKGYLIPRELHMAMSHLDAKSSRALWTTWNQNMNSL